MGKKILIIDDENAILKLLRDFFEILGYRVFTAMDGKEAMEKISLLPDIILLDVNLPGYNGLEVCQKIREHVHCPIIFLTARVEEQDRIQGFLAGGDDYVVKPFSIEELGARVLAHLRREERSHNNPVKSSVRIIGDLKICYEERRVFHKGEEIQLTKTEFDILALLSQNMGKIYSKEAIYEGLWGYDKEGDSNIITEHIRRIRVKFTLHSKEEYIKTIWGVGYKWMI